VGYLWRADEAGLDILGTESYVDSAYRGLTFGGWFYHHGVAATQGLASKWTAAGNQRAYLLEFLLGVGAYRLEISNNGIAAVVVTDAVVGLPSVDTWYFVVGRFDPSTEIAIFVNNNKTTNVAAIPAALFNSSAQFQIGAFEAGMNLLNGRVSMCFLCAAMLSDSIIGALWHQTRNMFGAS
jgi:hypothetical protein